MNFNVNAEWNGETIEQLFLVKWEWRQLVGKSPPINWGIENFSTSPKDLAENQSSNGNPRFFAVFKGKFANQRWPIVRTKEKREV